MFKRRPSRRVELPTERVCKSCKTLKAISEFQEQNKTREQDWVTYRHSCIECERAKSLERYYARQEAKKCSHCGGDLDDPEKKKCAQCLGKTRECQKRSLFELRVLVLTVYGARCSHCSDPRLECLQLDHVGGWGNKHKDKRGRRVNGMHLMRWARDNGFPRTLRLLCGSCHSALSFWGALPRDISFVRDRLNTVTRQVDASTDLLPVASPVTPITAPGQ
jgi:hypothetical protein